MNQTAKKLREAADHMSDGVVSSTEAIDMLRDMLDVMSTDTYAKYLGRVLTVIADELDELQARAAGANNLRQKLESAESKAECRKRHIGHLDTALHDKNALLEQRGLTIARLTTDNSELRKQVPSERERQILDMWPKFEDGEYVWFGDGVRAHGGAIIAKAIEFTRGAVCVKDAADGDWNASTYAMHPLKRPAQSVLDADGVEIKVGDTVWNEVGAELTVIAVDGKTKSFEAMRNFDGQNCVGLNPAIFTHTRPDSLERLVEDMQKSSCAYFDHLDKECDEGDECAAYRKGDCGHFKTIDIIRRARALAGIEVD